MQHAIAEVGACNVPEQGECTEADRLLETIAALLPMPRHEVTVLIPFDEEPAALEPCLHGSGSFS